MALVFLLGIGFGLKKFRSKTKHKKNRWKPTGNKTARVFTNQSFNDSIYITAYSTPAKPITTRVDWGLHHMGKIYIFILVKKFFQKITTPI